MIRCVLITAVCTRTIDLPALFALSFNVEDNPTKLFFKTVMHMCLKTDSKESSSYGIIASYASLFVFNKLVLFAQRTLNLNKLYRQIYRTATMDTIVQTLGQEIGLLCQKTQRICLQAQVLSNFKVKRTFQQCSSSTVDE